MIRPESGSTRGRPTPAPHKLSVAIVAASPRSTGGQSVQAEILMRHWQEDPELEVAFIPIDPVLPRWIAWVERLRGLRTLARQPFYWVALWRGMRGVECVHIFSASYWSFVLAPLPAWVIARLHGKRTLVNYHSGEAPDHLRRSRLAVALLRHADTLVVPSRFLETVFHRFGLEPRTVPNIVDVGQFHYRRRSPLRPLLLCTRGFHPYYGIDVVVQAFVEVKRSFSEARLCLVGKGPLEGKIRAMVSSRRLSGVDFVGDLPHDQISRVYDASDVFVNASWIDNMPLSILEAFASGTPVATTAPAGIRYLVDHERTGLLCEPGDWKGLADNVLRLLHDPHLASRIAESAQQESRRYTWDEVRDAWLQIYRSLARTRASTYAPG